MDTNKIITIDELHKELDMIQSCITRMANNSFMLKGWLITIMAGIIALTSESVCKLVVVFFVLFIDICFCYLDCFYLQQEKLYRYKYEWVIAQRSVTEERKNNRKYLYNLDPNNINMWQEGKKKPSIFEVTKSKAIYPLYLPAAVISIILVLFK